MKENRGRFFREHWAWFTVTILVLAGTVTLGYILFHDEDKPASEVHVEKVYFVMTDQDELETKMDIIVFVTNDGKAHLTDIKIRAFAVETDSNLARDEAEKTITMVKGDTTVEGTLTITLPNNDTYRVELLVFKEGKLIIRGSGTVNLVGVGQATPYKTGSGGASGYDDKEMDGGGVLYSQPALAGVCIIVFLLIGAVGVVCLIVYLIRKADIKETVVKRASSSRARQDYDVKNMNTWVKGNRYPCTVCGAPVVYGARQCPSCGIHFYQTGSFNYPEDDPLAGNENIPSGQAAEDTEDDVERTEENVDSISPEPVVIPRKVVRKEVKESADEEELYKKVDEIMENGPGQ